MLLFVNVPIERSGPAAPTGKDCASQLTRSPARCFRSISIDYDSHGLRVGRACLGFPVAFMNERSRIDL